MDRTPYERNLGIPGNCVRVYRTLAGEYGTPPEVYAQGGYWGHTDVVRKTGCPDDKCKLSLLIRKCPGLIERIEKKTKGKPTIALFRIAAQYDPRRPAPTPKPAVIQGVLV